MPSANTINPDDFDFIEKLGEGSYGTVWKAQMRETGELLAIKKVPADSDPADLKREVEFMRGCQSPYIVRYFGSCEQKGELWIVMEYCGAGSVSDLMKVCKRPLVEVEIAAVCKQVLQGLKYLHSKHKIHRDIKAGNILVNSKGECKLADFGVSGQLSDTMAKRNTVIGTPFWMAPEVIKETGYNEKADIWSLGITTIELAEMRPPYSDIHPMRAIFMIPSRDPPTLTEKSNWSDMMHDFVSCCLTKNPNNRLSAVLLLQHPFILNAKDCSVLHDLLQQQEQTLQVIGREKALGLDKASQSLTSDSAAATAVEGDGANGETGDDDEDGGENFGTSVFHGVPQQASSEEPDDSESSDMVDSGTRCFKSPSQQQPVDVPWAKYMQAETSQPEPPWAKQMQTESHDEERSIAPSTPSSRHHSSSHPEESVRHPSSRQVATLPPEEKEHKRSHANHRQSQPVPPHRKYESYSVEELTRMLSELDKRKDAEIASIKEKYNQYKKSVEAMLEDASSANP